MTAEAHPGLVVIEGEGGEQAPDDDTVEMCGRSFRVGQQVGLMPLLKFAHSAASGLDSADVEGMSAMYDLLKQCIHDDDWAAFERHATDARATDEDLMEVIQNVMAVLAERPTQRQSDSPPGLPTTNGSSGGDLSSRVKERLEQRGRPDLALVVLQASERETA